MIDTPHQVTQINLWLRISPTWLRATGTDEGTSSFGKPLAYSKPHDEEATRTASLVQQARLSGGKCVHGFDVALWEKLRRSLRLSVSGLRLANEILSDKAKI